MNLKNLKDEALINEVKLAIALEKDATLYLLEALREFESRKLYVGLGYPSLYEYVIRGLGLSEGSAHRRISAMRLMKSSPSAEEKLKTGELSVTNAARIYSTLKKEATSPERREEIIQGCLGSTQKECERRLAEFFPSPKDSVEVKLVLPRELHEKWEKLKNLTSHQNPAKDALRLFEILVAAELNRQEKKRCEGSETSFTPAPGPTPTMEVKCKPRSQNSNQRQPIPIARRRQAFIRADHRCERENCGSTYRLEVDRPVAFGGTNDLRNLRVLCKAHHRKETEAAQLSF